jgi:hypothetical protein
VDIMNQANPVAPRSNHPVATPHPAETCAPPVEKAESTAELARPAADAHQARALIDDGGCISVGLPEGRGGVSLRSSRPAAGKRTPPQASTRFVEWVADYNQLRFKVEAGEASPTEILDYVARKRRLKSPRRQAQLRHLLARFEQLRFRVLERTATAKELRSFVRIDRALSNPYRFEQEVARLLPFSDGFAAQLRDVELAEIESLDIGHNVRVARLEEVENKFRFMSENVLRHREAYALDGVVRNAFWTHTTRDGERVSSEREYYDAIYESYKTRLRRVLTASIVGVSGSPVPCGSILEAAQRTSARQKQIAASYRLPQDRPAIQRQVARRRSAKTERTQP